MGCLSFHHSIRIWSIIFCSDITCLKAISGCSRIFRFSRVRPTYSYPPLIATRGLLSLGPTSPFVCRLHIRLICRLALLGLIFPLPRLDCPVSRLWSCGAVGLQLLLVHDLCFLQGHVLDLASPICYQNVLPSLSTDLAFGQWRNSATSTTIFEMFLKNSFID